MDEGHGDEPTEAKFYCSAPLRTLYDDVSLVRCGQS